jgi:hypothetical protein
MKDIPDLKDPNASNVVEAFSCEEEHRLSQRLEIRCAPKHGSRLNMAETELSTPGRQRLNRRIPDIETMRRGVNALQKGRNNRTSRIKWQFTASGARIKLKRLYPSN